MHRAKDMGIPIIGVCRGAQMLCALAGGFLIQDVDNHAGPDHEVLTEEGERFMVSSLHHQMLYPFDVEHRMIATSKIMRSRGYYHDVRIDNGEKVEYNVEMPCEPEFVFFPKEKGIAIQWHPEYMRYETPANEYVERKIKELLNVG